MIPTDLRSQIRRDESSRLKPYLDCCGKPWRECACATRGALTIGWGRNLDAYGVTQAEADAMLDHDLVRSIADVVARLPVAARLDEVRRDTLFNMALNLGVGGLLKFTAMLSALDRDDYPGAAREMLDSLWARQVGPRAARLAEQMRSGVRQ